MSVDSLTSASAPTGAEPWLALPPALAIPPGAGAICDGEGARKIGRGAAEAAFTTAPVMVAHASLTARRLGIAPPPRSSDLLDVLELFAFVRPARFCAPSPSGLALAMGIPVLATLALAGRRFEASQAARLATLVAALAAIAHIAAFATAMRRYSVGLQGPLRFWREPGAWAPPFGNLTLLVLFSLAAAALLLLATTFAGTFARTGTGTGTAGVEAGDHELVAER